MAVGLLASLRAAASQAQPQPPALQRGVMDVEIEVHYVHDESSEKLTIDGTGKIPLKVNLDAPFKSTGSGNVEYALQGGTECQMSAKGTVDVKLNGSLQRQQLVLTWEDYWRSRAIRVDCPRGSGSIQQNARSHLYTVTLPFAHQAVAPRSGISAVPPFVDSSSTFTSRLGCNYSSQPTRSDVEVLPLAGGPPDIDHSKNSPELKALTGKKPTDPSLHGHTDFIEAAKPKKPRLEWRPGNAPERVGRGACVWVWSLRGVIPPLVVYINRDYPVGSCEYNVSLEHEMGHYWIMAGAASRFAENLRSALAAATFPTEDSSIVADSAAEGLKRISKYIDELTSASDDQLIRDLDASSALDDPIEREKQLKKCSGWVTN